MSISFVEHSSGDSCLSFSAGVSAIYPVFVACHVMTILKFTRHKGTDSHSLSAPNHFLSFTTPTTVRICDKNSSRCDPQASSPASCRLSTPLPPQRILQAPPQRHSSMATPPRSTTMSHSSSSLSWRSSRGNLQALRMRQSLRRFP
jgi:hypothetical protein